MSRSCAVLMLFCSTACVWRCGGGASPFSTEIMLRGESKGGILTLMKAPGWNYPYVIVTNRPGDAAAAVLGRLALALGSLPSEAKRYYGGNPVIEIREDALVVPGGGEIWSERPGMSAGDWILGGTDRGFNIPAAPTAVSASYVTNGFVIRWNNPPGGYDAIAVVYGAYPVAQLDGMANRFVFTGQNGTGRIYPWTDVTFLVLGCRGGTPSNGGAVRVREYRHQESLLNIPFTGGLAPGFVSWAGTPDAGVELEQGNLPGMGPGVDLSRFRFMGTGFFQVIKGRGDFRGGVCRRFLGLAAGHTYRVGARMSTLETKEGNWAFSLHAASDGPGAEGLTSAQLAGGAELPDGTKGSTAGQIARYGGSETTQGKWIASHSCSGGSGESKTDIMLPATGADSISVWFRLEGTNVTNTVAVGFDSVSIEDIGKQ